MFNDKQDSVPNMMADQNSSIANIANNEGSAAAFHRDLIGGKHTGSNVKADDHVTTCDATAGRVFAYASDQARSLALDQSAGKARFVALDGTEVAYSREGTAFTLPGGSRHVTGSTGVTDRFAQVTILRVPHRHLPHATRQETPTQGQSAIVYSDGDVDFHDGDETVTAEADPGKISWAQGERTIESDGQGKYYLSDQAGHRKEITVENARAYGAELSDGELRAGRYHFSRSGVRLADGSQISVKDGHVHLVIKHKNGAQGVAIDASQSGNLVSSGDSQSFMMGDDVVYTDSGGFLCHINIKDDSLDTPELSLDRDGASLHHCSRRIGFDGSVYQVKGPVGGVSIHEAMQTLRNLSYLVHERSVISLAHYEALSGAVAALKGSTVDCKAVQNWHEFQFVQNVSSLVDGILAQKAVKDLTELATGDPGVPLGIDLGQRQSDMVDVGMLVDPNQPRIARSDLPGQVAGARFLPFLGTPMPDLTDQLAKSPPGSAQAYRLPDVRLEQEPAGIWVEEAKPYKLISRNEPDQVGGTS